MGPMGAELVPFGSATAAKDFQAKNGGTVLGFGAITPEVLSHTGQGGMRMDKPMEGMKMDGHMGT